MMNEAEEDPRTVLAVERTLLAWVRTSVALMGLGFVVARFGVFLRAIPSARVEEGGGAVSIWLGASLVTLGVLVNLISAYQHWPRLIRSARTHADFGYSGYLAVALAIGLAVVGMGLVALLVFT